MDEYIYAVFIVSWVVILCVYWIVGEIRERRKQREFERDEIMKWKQIATKWRALKELESSLPADAGWKFYGGYDRAASSDYSDVYIYPPNQDYPIDQHLEPFEKWADEHLEED